MVLDFDPPVLNSACPWATTASDLRDLYECPYTGAVTTRTSLITLKGFPHDPQTHQYTFFNVSRGAPHNTVNSTTGGPSSPQPDETTSLNTLGYSPLSL